MARKRGQRKHRRISLGDAKAKQKVNFDTQPTRKERSLRSICVSLGLVTALLGSIVFYLINERLRSTPKNKARATIPESAFKDFEMEFKTPPVEWTGELPKQVLQDFRNAETVDDKLEHFDHLDQIGEKAREFFSNGPGSREKILKFKPLPKTLTSDGQTYLQMRAVLESGGFRMIYLRLDPAGPKIDFHSYARTNSHSFDDLINGKITEATKMRIGIRPDNFYLGEFQDDSTWMCFRGISPDFEEHISLYLRRDKMEKNLKNFVSGHRKATVTLELKSIGESHLRKQFEITKIHRYDWLAPPESESK